MTDERLKLVDPARARHAANDAFEAWRACYASDIPVAADIQHVGATSIPGALTKGDLDVAVRVAPKDFEAARQRLDETHTPNVKSVRDESFAAYECELFPVPVGVQLVVRGSRLDVFERFQIALLSEPDLLAEYNALKKRFEGRPMSAYRMSKAAFIKAVLSR